MNPIKFYISLVFFLLFISSTSGFLVEEGFYFISLTIINFIQDLLLLVLGFFSIKMLKKNQKLFWIIVSFFFLSLFSSFIENLSAITFLNGLREFFPFFLFPLIFETILKSNYRQLFIKKINIFLHLFLVIQIPVTYYQYINYGAGDFVGGTLGFGFSGILTIIIFLSTFYLLLQNFDNENKLRSLLKNFYLFIYWLPVFINETKISFFFILLFFLLLMNLSLRFFWKNIFLAFGLLMVIVFFQAAYENSTGKDFFGNLFDKEYLNKYLASNDDRFRETDIPRFQKFVLIGGLFDNHEIIIGKGLGHFKGGSLAELSTFASKYDWLLRGSRPMLFFLIVQVGLLGSLTFISYWIYLIFINKKKSIIKVSSKLILYTTCCLLIILLYNDSFRFLFFNGIIMYILMYALIPESYEIKLINP